MTTVGSASYYSSTDRFSAGGRSTATTNSDAAGSAASKKNSLDSSGAAGSGVDSRTSSGTLSLLGKIINATVFTSSNLKAVHASEMTEEDFARFKDMQGRLIDSRTRMLESQYTDESQTFSSAKSPRTEPYATVVVGGKVVATIDNQGVVGSDDALGKRLKDILLGEVNGTNGPDLAQARAEQIARLLGGRILGSDTAITQSEFNALPAPEAPKPQIDYEAMKNDPAYAEIEKMTDNLEAMERARQEYLARQ